MALGALLGNRGRLKKLRQACSWVWDDWDDRDSKGIYEICAYLLIPRYVCAMLAKICHVYLKTVVFTFVISMSLFPAMNSGNLQD